MPAALPGGRQNVPFVDEEHPGIHRYLRIGAGQLVTFRPVRGGSASVEQPGGGQDEGARTQRDDAASASCARRRAS